MTDTQRTMITHALNQKDLDYEVVESVRMVLSGKIETTPADIRALIEVLCSAKDLDDHGWKVAGIVQL